MWDGVRFGNCHMLKAEIWVSEKGQYLRRITREGGKDGHQGKTLRKHGW